MLTLNDVNLIEGETTCTTREYYAALQRAINSGMWGMQGSYGRAMMDAIKSGHCLLGFKEYNDYYRNHVPSRDQVVNGTVGSFDYVEAEQGNDWAQFMSEVK